MQLDPATVWLREEYGTRAFFPDSDNATFSIPPDHSLISVIVEGSESAHVLPHVATPAPPPRLPPVAGPSRKCQTVNVKVVQAVLKRHPGGKCEFTQLGQTFVDVTEATANVDYIRSAIQKKWGTDYIIVTADGLEIEDSSGTQGK